MRKYPRFGAIRRRPKQDGHIGVGKQCAVCGTWTVGKRHVELDYMRGNDDLVDLCAKHINDTAALEAIYADPGSTNDYPADVSDVRDMMP